jgi:hypothetical protein
MLNEARKAFDDPKQELYLHRGDDEWLAKQWAGFNKKYFGGKLKKPKNIEWKKMSSLGKACCDFDGKKIFTKYILISPKLENYPTFKNTLVHEMVHQWVYETYGTKDAIRYANSVGKARCRKWWNSIEKSFGHGSDGHHGTWQNKCAELMNKDSSLKLYKYGSTDETELSTREINKKIKTQGNTHVVVQEGDPRTPRRHFYYITDKAFNQLKKDIADGTIGGQWSEYEFDRKKFVQDFKNSPRDWISSSSPYYTGTYFDDLCERGIIDKWSKKILGGQKTEHHRRSRRSLFSWF